MATERTLTDVPGVEVGHQTDVEALTGVTVITFPDPNVAVVDVRGGAPGSREFAIFGEAIKPMSIDALVFAGGSAFGLAAAQGTVEALEAEGKGYPTPVGPVPIVPAAIIFDLLVGRSDVRPTPADGAAAYASRSGRSVPRGPVGAGTGATVGKVNGVDGMSRAGVGSSSVPVDEATVGALVVLNAVGDVYDLAGHRLTGSADLDRTSAEPFGFNTTLIAVVTDAGIDDRNELRRLAVRAHDALAATVRPAHTRYDGDSVFVVSAGRRHADVDALGEAVFSVVASSIVDAVLAGRE